MQGGPDVRARSKQVASSGASATPRTTSAVARCLLLIGTLVLIGLPPAPANATPALAVSGEPYEAAVAVADHLLAQSPGPRDVDLLEAAWRLNHNPTAWPKDEPIADRVAAPAPPTAKADILPMLHVAYVRAATGVGNTTSDGQHVAELIRASFDGTQFGQPSLVNDDVWSLRVLVAIHVVDGRAKQSSGSSGTVPAADDPMIVAINDAVTSVLAQQNPDGGWSWTHGGPSDTDSTGMALVALSGAQEDIGLPGGHWVDQATRYLADNQNGDGGYGSDGASDSNCDSTVWGIRGQAAATGHAAPGAWSWLRGLKRVEPDGASYAYLAGDVGGNALCTGEVLVLLADAAQGHVALDGWSSQTVGPPTVQSKCTRDFTIPTARCSPGAGVGVLMATLAAAAIVVRRGMTRSKGSIGRVPNPRSGRREG